jgi:redox-sensitive bicupin YhaK (pirin superfamily)
MKSILGVYRNQDRHWVGDGFPVKNLFSYNRLGQELSPFLMLDYAAPYHFEATRNQRGVGAHPHRGFETVTLAYEGEVTHKDSSGGGGVIRTGDVQWMTAGSGVIHEEFHSEEYAARGGLFEMVQLWVNLPAAHKMTAPKYQALEKADIPVVPVADGEGSIRVVAGEFASHQGPASTFSAINLWDGRLNTGASTAMTVPQGHTVLLVLLDGEIAIGNQTVLDSSVVVFKRDNETAITFDAIRDSKFVILTGEPLNEPIEGYGPFVMNTRDEIVQAFNDYNAGKFGRI